MFVLQNLHEEVEGKCGDVETLLSMDDLDSETKSQLGQLSGQVQRLWNARQSKLEDSLKLVNNEANQCKHIVVKQII